MKTLILFTLFVSSLPSFATCPIYSEAPVSKSLAKALETNDFVMTSDKKARYSLEQDGVDLATAALEVKNGTARIIRKRWGFTTIFNIQKDQKFFHQSYGDAINIFADEYYLPSIRLKNRSHRKAVRNLKENIPACEE